MCLQFILLYMGTTGVDSHTDTENALSRDEVFDLLSNHRRRYALHAVKHVEGPLDLSDVAEQVAAWENGKSREEITAQERHRVYTSMQQTHLPAMDRAGVIEYDNGTVTLADGAENLEVYMDIVPEQSIPWGEYYLGLAAVSGALLAAVSAGVFPESIPALAWGWLVVVLLAGSALYHVVQSRRMRLGATDTPPEIEE